MLILPWQMALATAGKVTPDPIFAEIGKNGINNSGHASLTISSVNIPAGDVFVAAGFNLNRGISSITIDGSNNMTELLDINNGNARLGIWGFSGYTGGSNVDIVLTPSSSATFSAAIAFSVENPNWNAESDEFTDSVTGTSNATRALSISNTNSRQLAVFAGLGNSGSAITMTGDTGSFDANYTFKLRIGYTFPATGDDPVDVTVNSALLAGGVVLNDS